MKLLFCLVKLLKAFFWLDMYVEGMASSGKLPPNSSMKLSFIHKFWSFPANGVWRRGLPLALLRATFLRNHRKDWLYDPVVCVRTLPFTKRHHLCAAAYTHWYNSRFQGHWNWGCYSTPNFCIGTPLLAPPTFLPVKQRSTPNFSYLPALLYRLVIGTYMKYLLDSAYLSIVNQFWISFHIYLWNTQSLKS